MKKHKGPKVLIVDIETAPMVAYVWGLFDQNIGLNQILEDWHLLSFAAKWAHESKNKMIYMDQRYAKNRHNDKKMVKALWELFDEADIIVGQNSKEFDVKKINDRFQFHGMQPPSPYKQIDNVIVSRKNFASTSHKLEYKSSRYNKEYTKLSHHKFPGFEMWSECLKGNIAAFKEMEKYNKHDVLAAEEEYKRLIPWDNSINYNLYRDDDDLICNCGSKRFKKKGYAYTASGKYQRYKCKSCGASVRGKKNLLSKEKRSNLRPKA